MRGGVNGLSWSVAADARLGVIVTTRHEVLDVEDVRMIVRDLHYKHLAGTLQPIDEAIRRVLQACLRRGLESGDASPEERDLAAELGVTVDEHG